METTKEVQLYNSENIVVHSNDFIQARYKDKVTFWEMVLFGRMCSMIDPYDKEFRDYEIHVKDIIESLGLERSGKIYEYVLDAAQRLLDRKVVIYFKDEKGDQKELETYLVTSVERYTKRESNDKLVINLTFHPKLKPFLLELSRDFTKLDINNYKFLHTGSGIRIYQILKQYLGKRQKVVEVKLDDLKNMLGVGDKYESYNRFKVKVLDEAQKRLEKTTDVKFTYEEVKNSKKIVAIKFHIMENNPPILFDEEIPTDATPSVLKDSVSVLIPPQEENHVEQFFNELYPLVGLKWKVSPKVLMDLIEKHSESDIQQAIRVTERALQANKIKDNVAGFFVKAVHEGYKDSVEQISQKKTSIKAKTDVITQIEKEKTLKKQQIQSDLYRKEEAIFLKLIQENASLLAESIEKIQYSMFRTSYDSAKSIDENLKNNAFKAALFNTIKSLKPDAFM
jgi:plasmid replication initiation protein